MGCAWLGYHSRVCELLGLNPAICRVIDNMVDKEPPMVKEVLPYQDSEERGPVHSGFRKTEFPLIYRYVVKNYGLEGTKCLLVHFLDHVENVLRKGYSREMVKDTVVWLLEEYKRECGIEKELCIDYVEVFRDREQAKQ